MLLNVLYDVPSGDRTVNVASIGNVLLIAMLLNASTASKQLFKYAYSYSYSDISSPRTPHARGIRNGVRINLIA